MSLIDSRRSDQPQLKTRACCCAWNKGTSGQRPAFLSDERPTPDQHQNGRGTPFKQHNHVVYWATKACSRFRLKRSAAATAVRLWKQSYYGTWEWMYQALRGAHKRNRSWCWLLSGEWESVPSVWWEMVTWSRVHHLHLKNGFCMENCTLTKVPT